MVLKAFIIQLFLLKKEIILNTLKPITNVFEPKQTWQDNRLCTKIIDKCIYCICLYCIKKQYSKN